MTQPHARTLAARQVLLAVPAEGASMTEACRRAGIRPPTVRAHAAADPEFGRRLAATARHSKPGRPRDTSWHQTVLDAIADGDTFKGAASRARIRPALIGNHRRIDPEFAAALDEARRRGEAVRAARRSPPEPVKVTKPRVLKPCGTRAAYVRHLSKGEDPCEECRKANSHETRGRASYAIAVTAATRARRRLATTHREELQVLVARERARTDRSPKGARVRASNVLARLHRDEYRVLLAQEREAIQADPDRKAVSRWRKGARDDAARAAHNAESERLRHRAVRRAFRPVEARLLDAISRGIPVAQAAAQVELTVQALFGRARWDEAWAVRLDTALVKGRDPGIAHGTEYTYRVRKCRCPDCRNAKGRYR